MYESKFLSGYSGDASLRLRLWELFRKTEREAKRFVEDEKDWYEIVEVQNLLGQGGGWWRADDTRHEARIGIVPMSNDLGAIFHEIFHSAFHNSLLHGKAGEAKEDYDRDWGDPFCEAFRYFMEKRLLDYTSSKWFGEMDRVCQVTFDEGIREEYPRDPDLYKKYRYPGSLIIKKASSDYNHFRDLWFQLVLTKQSHVTRPMLNDFFSYDVQTGLPILKKSNS